MSNYPESDWYNWASFDHGWKDATPCATFKSDLLILQRRSFNALEAATKKLANAAGRDMRTNPDAFALFTDAHDSAFEIDRRNLT